jgi:hypothetical protein
MGCPGHGRLFCDDCGHTSTHLEVTHWFANRMQHMVQNPHLVGEFSCVGLLWEYNNMMSQV